MKIFLDTADISEIRRATDMLIPRGADRGGRRR